MDPSFAWKEKEEKKIAKDMKVIPDPIDDSWVKMIEIKDDANKRKWKKIYFLKR